jgi:hypothetical protein
MISFTRRYGVPVVESRACGSFGPRTQTRRSLEKTVRLSGITLPTGVS